MTSFSIEAQVRVKDENCKHLRKQRILPWVVYGKNQEPISLKMDYSDFLKTFRKAWESSIINLKVGKKDIEVLIHEYQKEPVTGDFIHVDFFALTRWETLHTKVELKFVWDSEAVKLWAVLEELTKEVEIEVLPKDLIDHIEVDLSALKNFEDNIKVSDLKVPDTIKILTPADTVVVLAAKPRKVEEEITEEVSETTTEETAETTEENK